MIDFSCKKFNIAEIIKCSLGLSRSEFLLLEFLMKNKNDFTTEDLSKKLKLDKSTIQRAVKKLHGKQLVNRGQINREVGGYIFYYRIKDKNKIKKIILGVIDGWIGVVRNGINNW